LQRRWQSVHFKRHTTNDRFKTSASHGENVWSWKVNRQLKNDLDNLEKYGRRNLIRFSGIHEPVDEVDTTETVCKLISEIEPEYKPTDVIRSHKVGKISQPGSFNRKTRQIIVRLAVPSVKMRLEITQKCGKKTHSFKSVYINEDLTGKRTKIFYHARQLLKSKTILHLDDKRENYYEGRKWYDQWNKYTPEAFRTIVDQLTPQISAFG
jgi:hypothetical protein